MTRRSLAVMVLAAALVGLAGSIATAQQVDPSPVPTTKTVGIDIKPGDNALMWSVYAASPRVTGCWATPSFRREGETTPIATLFTVHLTGADEVQSGGLPIGHLGPGPYLVDVADSGCAWVIAPATR